MKPGVHIIIGGIASVAIYPFPSLPGVFFWLASVVTDLDHYLDYVFHNGFKDFKLKRAILYHNVLRGYWQRPEFLNLSPFHSVEFVAALYMFSLFNDAPWTWALFWGLVFHILLDIIYLIRHKSSTLRAYSVVEYWIRKKRLVSMGLSPGAVYADAVKRVNQTEEE